MISKIRKLFTRVEQLEREVKKLARDIHGTYGSFSDDYIVGLKKRVDLLEQKEPILSVPVVDEHGEYLWKKTRSFLSVMGGHDRHDISLAEAFEALEKMCDIEITYQEIKGSKGVVIYEKDQ